MRGLAYLAITIAAAGGGVALSSAAVPSRGADERPLAAPPARAVELRAGYDAGGQAIGLRGEEARRPVLAARAARLRASAELGWLRRVAERRIDGRRVLVLRARRGAPVDGGWTFAVDPRSYAPLAAERRAGGRVVERRRLLLGPDVASLRRALTVVSDRRRLTTPFPDSRSIDMNNKKLASSALAALAAVSAMAGAASAASEEPPTPVAAPAGKVHHWVIVSKTMAGARGRVEGWQRGADRHVEYGDAGGPGFPWCTPGRAQDWRLIGGRLSICGKALARHDRRSGFLPAQIMNPAEYGQVQQGFIDRGALVAAGEDVLAGRRVTVWREADKAGFEPEEERKLTLSTVYLDAADGSFVGRRDENAASGGAQVETVVVDEMLDATSASVARAGLKHRATRRHR